MTGSYNVSAACNEESFRTPKASLTSSPSRSIPATVIRERGSGLTEKISGMSESKSAASFSSQIEMIEAILQQQEDDRMTGEPPICFGPSSYDDYEDSDMDFASEFDSGDRAQVPPTWRILLLPPLTSVSLYLSTWFSFEAGLFVLICIANLLEHCVDLILVSHNAL